MRKWMLVGLGNPGKRYRDTRHNAGFWILGALAETGGWRFKKRAKFSAWLAEGEWKGDKLLLVKPATYVNTSGTVVKRLIDYFGIPSRRTLLVVDDVNLPPGRLRIRRRGGAGGHHGLESVIAEIGVEDFPRLRLGVGGGELEDLTGYVLSRVGKEERAIYKEAVGKAVASILNIIEDGLESAMEITN